MNFTPEKLKTAKDSGYTDDEIWNFLGKDDQRFNLAKENGYTLEDTITTFSKVSPPEPERREGGGVVGGAADIGIQFMKGLGTGTRMISDVFGANNPVSKSIAGYEDYFDSLLSAESKQDSQEISRILKEAEGKGILPQIMAGLEAFTVAPAEMTASTMGMMLPNLAGGVYSKAAQLTKAGVIGLQMGIGAAQGAGSIKGQIYTAVQEELRQQGLPEDKIDDIATEAQAYNGKNLDQILIGAGLGAAASSTGAEKIMTRLITGAGKEASEDIIKAVIKGGFSEAPIEALQGGQEKIAENVALQRIGVDVPTMQGVIPAATMEATAGLLIGGGFGGVEAVTSPEQKEEKKIDKQSNQVANELLAENTPATQSVVKELARRENAVTNLQEAYDALEPTSQEAQKLKLELSEAQRNLSAFKGVANKAGLSETITEAERQQIELAKAITKPAPKPLPTDVLPTETPGATYGREEQIYDVFGGITRKPVSIPKPAELPAAPTIEEQTAEKTYGGETGVFDVFAGARRKPVVPEAPAITPAPVAETPAVTEAPAAEVAPAEEGQFSIYQMERKDGMRWLVQSGEKRGFGDAIFNTKEDAEKYASDEKLRQQQRASMVEREAQIKRDEEAAKELREKNVNEFTTAIGATPIAAGKIKKTLMEKAAKRTGGKVYEGTRAEIVEQFVAIGFKPTIAQVDAVKDLTRAQFNRMDNRQQAEFEKKKKAAGKKNEYRLENAEGYLFDVTKAEYDYANWLETRSEIKPAPAIKPEKILSERAIRTRIEDNYPVPANAIEAYGITLPEGYTKQGDLYVYQPAVSETITPAAEPAGKPEEVTPRKPATFPTMPSIEEQTAEKVYGGETGLYDPFAGVQKKRTKAEDPAGRRGTEDQIKNADEHAAEIGGTVLYQDGDISLIRGYSLWGGNPVYIVANKGSRARTDISSYTGNLATPEQKAQLVDIKNKIETEDQASFNSKPFITFTDGIAFSNGVPSTIAGVLRGWKSLLNIKANLYVTTYDDAVADKDKFNGPHRVIGSAGLASSKVDGSIRKMPNGDFYIMFREIPSRTKMLETLAHELGHLHEKEAFENADTATKRMLREEHDKWVKSQTGKTAKELVTSLRAVKTAKANLGAAEGMMADELSAYWKSFGEWYADQVSRWAVSTEKPLTIVDKFFSRIAKALRSFYANITNRGYLPNETFVQYLEKTLKEPARIVSEPIMEGEGVEQLSQQLGGEPTGKPEQIAGEEVGPPKKTPEGIIAKTQELLRKKFNPAKVTEQNTTEAFRALGRLIGRGGTDFAKELNDIGRVVDKSGAASEISMGAALFINDLFEYSIRLAAEGNKKMLGIMLTNINKLPTAGIGASDAARDLRARLELAQRFRTMGDAEQDAFINYTAEFIYGPNPTKDQIQSIKTGYDAVEKVQEPTAEEVEEEIAAVGEKTGTDLVGRINDEFTKATEKGQAKRKTEIEELDSEYKKIQEQADKEIEKLAKIQSDTPSFDPTAARQTANDVRAIVANDLKQRPDMGRKAPWKSMLVAKLQEAGVEVAAAETLADIVWRQHEINSLSRELSSINKAVEKGPISEIVKAIKDTPLEEQQNPNWRYEVMRDYLRRAGLSLAQAERIAKLMDISLQKRFTQAKEQAFTDAISKTAPWKAGDVRSKRAFQQVIQAIRAGALDPSRNMASDIAALNGWTGFSADQYKNLLKNDAILASEDSKDIQKAEAYKAIQDIISKSKLPIRARDVIGQYYDAQALSGIPTLTVNSFSPIAFAMRNAIVEASSGTIKGDAKAIGRAATAFVDSIKSWANTVAFSFKNNVTVYSNVDYIVNDDNLLRLYRKGVDQFTKSKNAKERADGVKNMMIGMMDYVRRILNALDYGAIASLQNQNISKYAMAVMKRQKMNDKQANEMFAVMMKAKNDFYLQQIAIGTDKNKAGILADEFYISSWKEALSKAGVEKSDIQQAMDAAINDALSSVGRNRQSLDAFKEEDTKLKDAGVSSMPALWLLESVANAANRSDNQIIKLFSRVIYGFAIVPARVIRETAWFSPYGFVRFGYDAIAKKMGKTSPYAQSLGTDIQYSQRLNEAVAGTVALVALLALRAGSTDDPEDEDAFKIVFTGNGPQRKDDAQFYDSWYKAGNKPNSMILSFGKTKFTLNMMRGFEAFTWPAMMLGALDDLEIRKKQKQQTKTPGQLEDAAIVAGFVFDAALRRGPYAFTTKSLFGTYGDIGVEGVAKGLTFPAKTLIPVLGTSLASNLSNFLNDPIDRRTLDGAVWSNIPFIGPAVAPKSLNAFGEPSLSTDFASKMFKLGVPIVYDIPTDRESIKLHELVLKQGGGPSIPTRNQLAQRLDRQPTNKEYEMFVREYGTILTTSMKKNYDKLFNAKPEFYSKAVERIGNRARDVAENKVRQAAKKP